MLSSEREALPALQLGHQIVVVSVKPFRHLERPLISRAAREREVAAEIAPVELAEALGDRTQRPGRVEHVVIQAEVTTRDHIDPPRRRQPPAAAPQAPRGLKQFRLAGTSGPEGLQRELQLPLAADAGKPKDGGTCHRSCSLSPCGPCSRGRCCRLPPHAALAPETESIGLRARTRSDGRLPKPTPGPVAVAVSRVPTAARQLRISNRIP